MDSRRARRNSQPSMATTGCNYRIVACLLSHITCVTYVHRSNLAFIFHDVCKWMNNITYLTHFIFIY